MHLKTYKAPDLASALAMARAELGPSALVLATNEIRGGMGLTTVEITVAAERAAPPPQTPMRAAPPPRDPARVPAAGPPHDANEDTGADLAPSLRVASRALVRAGLSEDLAARFARIALARGSSRGVPEHAAGAVLAQLFEFRPVRRARVLFVVGPPGCGKTTTAAKLAARWTVDSRRHVVMAQADADRIGAMEQSDIFARHLGLRLAAVRARADLSRLARDTAGDGSILVDTAGVGAADARRLNRVAELRRTAPEAEVALLLPSGLHHQEARRVLDRFACVEPTCVVLTKVDDGVRPGELVTAVESTGLPIAFFTTGHRVPQDLEDASPGRLASLLFRSGFDPGSKEGRRAV